MRCAPATVLLLVLTACGGSDPDVLPATPTTTSASSTSTRAPATTLTTPPPPPVTDVPDPTTPAASRTPPIVGDPTEPVLSDKLQEYMLRLEAILPEITNDASEAIDRGNRVCRRASADVAYPELIKITKEEFGGPNAKPLSDQQAAGVYEVIRDQLCPA